MAPKRVGKTPNFTDEQNAVLRDVLIEFMERNGENQPSMAKRLKVEQPSVGRWIQSKNPTGFAYPIATKIAQLGGYIGVDALFAAKGVALDAVATLPDPTKHGNQAQAMIHVRAIGVSEKAIQLVNKRHANASFHTTLWWSMRYSEQEESLREARAELAGKHPHPEADTDERDEQVAEAVERPKRALPS